MKVVLAKSAVDFLRADDQRGATAAGVSGSAAMQAARRAVELLGSRTAATGGLILLDRDGAPGFAFNTPRMAYGYVAGDGTFVTAVNP
jgi:beta-aspartyl-peptidase (threonine type)